MNNNKDSAMFAMQPVSQVPLWIDNQEVHSDILFPVVNSEKGVPIHEAYGATPELAIRAVDSAQKAFADWRNKKPWERRDLLLKAADYMQQRRREVSNLLEVPAPEVTIENVNIDDSIGLLKELAGAVCLATNGVVPHTRAANTFAVVLKEPYGVHLGIAPWNSSLFLAMRAVMTPIACGNTAILKASELSPAAHHFIARMLADVGFPPGVLNVIQHRREDAPKVLEALISHPGVRKVNFTGSTAVGKKIAEMAARYCKPTLMELGGKSPQIVFEDADLDEAAQAAVTGGFLHHGQICMSTDTIIAHTSIVKQLTEKMVSAASSWPMTSAVSEAGVEKTESLVKDALLQGASLANPAHNVSHNATELAKSNNLHNSKVQLRPVILTDVDPKMRIYHEETFGPALSILVFNTEEEAIRLANESIYGLSSSMFTQNIPKAMKIARQIDSGAVHINSMSIHDEQQLPHGGMKSSGWGRFGVPWGFDEFMQLKTITITSNDLQT